MEIPINHLRPQNGVFYFLYNLDKKSYKDGYIWVGRNDKLWGPIDKFDAHYTDVFHFDFNIKAREATLEEVLTYKLERL